MGILDMASSPQPKGMLITDAKVAITLSMPHGITVGYGRMARWETGEGMPTVVFLWDPCSVWDKGCGMLENQRGYGMLENRRTKRVRWCLFSYKP